jgi:hypothetical protein
LTCARIKQGLGFEFGFSIEVCDGLQFARKAFGIEVSNEIGSPIRCDQALDRLMALGNCRAQFKAKSGLSVRKLLYGRWA